MSFPPLFTPKTTWLPAGDSSASTNLSLRQAPAREYKVDLKEVAEYFPLQTTMTGMMETIGNLFGLVFTELQFKEGARAKMVWREDVQVFSA